MYVKLLQLVQPLFLIFTFWQMYQTADAMETHPCQKSDEATCIYITHSTATKEKVDEVVEVIQYDLHGIAGLIVQHM